MEPYHELLVTLVRLVSTLVVIILFFMFLVRPMLNYFLINREIERKKRRAEMLQEEDDALLQHQTEGLMPGPAAKVSSDSPAMERKKTKLTDMEKLTRLASSDPEKAGELVKQWVNKS